MSANCRQLFRRHHPALGLVSAVLGKVFTLRIRLLGLAGEDATLLSLSLSLSRSVPWLRHDLIRDGWQHAEGSTDDSLAAVGFLPMRVIPLRF